MEGGGRGALSSSTRAHQSDRPINPSHQTLAHQSLESSGNSFPTWMKVPPRKQPRLRLTTTHFPQAKVIKIFLLPRFRSTNPNENYSLALGLHRANAHTSLGHPKVRLVRGQVACDRTLAQRKHLPGRWIAFFYPLNQPHDGFQRNNGREELVLYFTLLFFSHIGKRTGPIVLPWAGETLPSVHEVRSNWQTRRHTGSSLWTRFSK
jgi:hypothetical protein